MPRCAHQVDLITAVAQLELQIESCATAAALETLEAAVKTSADGSQIALTLDLGAHHLDLMFSDPRNPPCFAQARAIEEERIKLWCQQAYDAL